MDQNMNVAICLKSASYWGYEKVYNVCTGTNSEVPWGTVDWLGAVALTFVGGSVGLLLIAMLVGISFMVISDL